MQPLHTSFVDASPSSLTPTGREVATRVTSLLMAGALALLAAIGATPALAQTARQAAPASAPASPAATAAPAGTAAQVSFAERALVGTWYGESGATGPAGAQLQRFLTTRRPDGTYSLEVRTYENGKPTIQLTNTGLWGISNSLFFTITTEVNGQRTAIREPAYTAAYLVRGITGNEFVYQHIASGRELRVVRAAPDARLPD